MTPIQMLEFIQSWLSPSKTNIGFEDIKYAIQKSAEIIIINTLSNLEQGCLIYGTISYDKEESIINQLLENRQINRRIILYGKHSTDELVNKKKKQLNTLGFINVYVYVGGLFEWLLLQDIYGHSEFPTTSLCKDMLIYRPPPKFTSIPQIMM